MLREGFAVQLDWVTGTEVLKHGEADEQGVARGPRGGAVVEEMELNGEAAGVALKEGVDAARVGLEL